MIDRSTPFMGSDAGLRVSRSTVRTSSPSTATADLYDALSECRRRYAELQGNADQAGMAAWDREATDTLWARPAGWSPAAYLVSADRHCGRKGRRVISLSDLKWPKTAQSQARAGSGRPFFQGTVTFT